MSPLAAEACGRARTRVGGACRLSLCAASAGLAEDFLKDYIQVNIGSVDLCANRNITQVVEICEDYDKDQK